ncbi:MAG: sulfotransferase [Desulfuromonadales bacterium]|nr:sulfotransferase [Desulfuromonadales bacterium]
MESTKYLIISMRRTGGTLLGCLLDGHPDCSVFPFEYWNTRKKAVYDWLGHRLFRWMPASFKRNHCGRRKVWEKKFVRAHGPLRWREFYESLLVEAERATSAADLYDRTTELYFNCFHQGGLNRVVVNHCADLCLLRPEQLHTMFGEARYIMILRDPRAAFASTELKDQKSLKAKGKIDAVAFDHAGVVAYCDRWRRAVEKYYLGSHRDICLRFEDLVCDTEKTMGELVSSMGIPYDDTLLTPLRNGEIQQSNSSFAPVSNGIDSSVINTWRAHLAPEWRHLIEDQLGDIMEQVGYRIDDDD